MSVYADSAFIAEIIRGGIAAGAPAVVNGRLALALGLCSLRGSTRQIVIPQAMRAVVPAIVPGNISTLLKNSSLAAAIGYPDLHADILPVPPLNQSWAADRNHGIINGELSLLLSL